MQSLTVNIIPGLGSTPSTCFLHVINQDDLRQRIKALVIEKTTKGLLEKHNCVSSRTMFEKNCSELFFLPKGLMDRSLSDNNLLNNIALLQLESSWGLVICCFSYERAHNPGVTNRELLYTKEAGYPSEASQAAHLSIASLSVSLLFCETGRIVMGLSGEVTLQGLELAFLQTKRINEQGLFCKKKKLDHISPARPLPLGESKPFIKIRCYCKAPGFSFLLNIPVLTEEEVRDKIDLAGILTLKGTIKEKGAGSIEQYDFFPTPTSLLHVLALPHGMNLQLPFDQFLKGDVYFSSKSKGSSTLQLVFIPHHSLRERCISRSCHRSFATWATKGASFSAKYVKSNRASLYSNPSIFLSPGPGLERKILGAKMKLIATAHAGSWGMFVSRKKEGSSSVSSPKTQQEGISSSAPGLSGIGSRESTASLAQATASASVPPDRQGKHTQQKGRIRTVSKVPVMHNLYKSIGQWDKKCFVPGPSGVRWCPYAQCGPKPSGFGFYPFPPQSATDPFLSEGQKQQKQQGGRRSRPDMPYFPPLASSAPEALQRRVIRPLPVQAQEESTVSVPREGQSQCTGSWDRRGFLSRPSGVRHHTYAQCGPESSGFGLDLYRFPSPPPGATGPFLSEGQEQQAQQSGRSRHNMIFFPPLASVIIDPFAPKAPQQGIESSSRQSVIVSVGSVQQTTLWKPYEEKKEAASTAEASQQAQKEKSDEDEDIDVEN